MVSILCVVSRKRGEILFFLHFFTNSFCIFCLSSWYFFIFFLSKTFPSSHTLISGFFSKICSMCTMMTSFWWERSLYDFSSKFKSLIKKIMRWFFILFFIRVSRFCSFFSKNSWKGKFDFWADFFKTSSACFFHSFREISSFTVVKSSQISRCAQKISRRDCCNSLFLLMMVFGSVERFHTISFASFSGLYSLKSDHSSLTVPRFDRLFCCKKFAHLCDRKSIVIIVRGKNFRENRPSRDLVLARG